uniref:HAD domain-containing protein n=1 Tax=Pedobacter schmidteae TaxID=2201271 RepID=UPI000EB30AF3|nr:HAD domain-containing protein [Pedobacter schmidteae]
MKFFLDIDGVMVHANPHKPVDLEKDGFYKFNTIAVNILKSVLYETKDEVILSTSHRFKYDINRWKEIFLSRGIKMNHISIIETSYSSTRRISRKTEIEHWIIENHIKSSDVVIIDDDKSLNDLPKYLKDRLVLTNPYTGLNNITDLTSILKRRLKQRFEEKVK